VLCWMSHAHASVFFFLLSTVLFFLPFSSFLSFFPLLFPLPLGQ
jgi:hypothetical protein